MRLRWKIAVVALLMIAHLVLYGAKVTKWIDRRHATPTSGPQSPPTIPQLFHIRCA